MDRHVVSSPIMRKFTLFLSFVHPVRTLSEMQRDILRSASVNGQAFRLGATCLGDPDRFIYDHERRHTRLYPAARTLLSPGQHQAAAESGASVSIEGRGEFAGAKGSLEFTAAQGEAIEALAKRVVEFERFTKDMRIAGQRTTEEVQRLQSPGGEHVEPD